MSTFNEIHLRFTAKNNQLSLEYSSTNRAIESSTSCFAGSKLTQVMSRLQNPDLARQAQKIEATLRPILEGNATFYYMELKIDGKAFTASSATQPLKIKLNQQFVQALSGNKNSAKPISNTQHVLEGSNKQQPSIPPKQNSLPPVVSQSSNIPTPQSSKEVKTLSPLQKLWAKITSFIGFNQREKPIAQTNPSSTSLHAMLHKNMEKASLQFQGSANVTVIEGIRPLANTGNNCFVNAIFQVIMQDAVLLQALLKTFKDDQSIEACAFKQAVSEYQNNRNPMSVGSLRHFINKWGSQQDASELLAQIINRLDPHTYPQCFTSCTTDKTATLKNSSDTKKGAPLTILLTDTQPEFLIPLQLIHTETKDIPLEGQYLVDQLQVAHAQLGQSFKRDSFVYQPQTEAMSIDPNASRLVFQLKRFTKNGKIVNPVDMPDVLKVSGNDYHLKSIVVHQGDSVKSGHYYSLIHTEQSGWIKCNDSHVAKVGNISNDRMNGYLYFYEKKD